MRLRFLALLALPALGVAQDIETSSTYIQARDGVRLALDVHLPSERVEGKTLPALLVLTRYWRSSENPTSGAPNPALDELDRHFLENGYAIVKVDARGSGASFGTRPVEYGAEEVKDARDVVEWIIAQPWASGDVGAYGTSYTGTTAELLAAVEHPAVKAVIPGWSDFDLYVSPVRPYGLVASSFIRQWSKIVGWQDAGDSAQLGASVRRVDVDSDGALLRAAIEEHTANPDVFESVREAEYRDDELGGVQPFAGGPLGWTEEIERSAVPMLVLVSWLDAGTIDGALQRLRHLSNPQKVVIMATNHGGASHASPFVVDRRRVGPVPSVLEQLDLRLAFFDHWLKGADNGADAWPAVRYYNLGEEAFRESETWPPCESRTERFYLREGGSLLPSVPLAADAGARAGAQAGADDYAVDFSVSTGRANRWSTQMGGPVLGLSDRGTMDERMLVYTSEPLEADLQVTGAPVITLEVTSDRSDVALLVYLEDVDADGRSRYVTEGGLRALHRKPWTDPKFGADGPLHSFRRADGQPLVPGERARVRFRLWPTSVLFEKGHRIRIAIAGADADTFDRLPVEGDVTLTIERSATHPSFVELPVCD